MSKPLYEAREENAPVDIRIGVDHKSMYREPNSYLDTFTFVQLIGPGMRGQHGAHSYVGGTLTRSQIEQILNVLHIAESAGYERAKREFREWAGVRE